MKKVIYEVHKGGITMEELNNMEIVDIDIDTDEYTLVLFVNQGE